MVLHAGRLYITLYDAGSIVELEPATGRLIATDPAPSHPAAITVNAQGEVVVAAGTAFGIALVGSALWTADYRRSVITPAAGGKEVPLPLPVHPFWLAPGSSDELLIAAEGESEDTDPGAVFSYHLGDGTFSTLGRPRDPDQVLESGGAVFVAAHGDREVIVFNGLTTQRWANGAAAVAVAPDTAQGLLVVAVNSHE
jgi:hypothetical protein